MASDEKSNVLEKEKMQKCFYEFNRRLTA